MCFGKCPCAGGRAGVRAGVRRCEAQPLCAAGAPRRVTGQSDRLQRIARRFIVATDRARKHGP
jgi:hypothetical protein